MQLPLPPTATNILLSSSFLPAFSCLPPFLPAPCSFYGTWSRGERCSMLAVLLDVRPTRVRILKLAALLCVAMHLFACAFWKASPTSKPRSPRLGSPPKMLD